MEIDQQRLIETIILGARAIHESFLDHTHYIETAINRLKSGNYTTYMHEGKIPAINLDIGDDDIIHIIVEHGAGGSNAYTINETTIVLQDPRLNIAIICNNERNQRNALHDPLILSKISHEIGHIIEIHQRGFDNLINQLKHTGKKHIDAYNTSDTYHRNAKIEKTATGMESLGYLLSLDNGFDDFVTNLNNSDIFNHMSNKNRKRTLSNIARYHQRKSNP